MTQPTLLDIIKNQVADPVVGLIDETTRAHPEITMAAARPIKGVSYRTLVRTALGNPQGGSFRSANAGSVPIVHRYENREVQCFILEPRFQCDRAVADAHPDGAAFYIAQENEGTLEGEFQGLSKVFYYGQNATFGNAGAFPGLLAAYDSANMVVDAGGTTDSVASSVWAVKFGVKYVQWLMGQNGSLNFSALRIESIIDPNDSTKRFDGYVQTMVARPGLQVGTTQCIGRIKKLTTDTGKGLTDALLSTLLSKFKVGMVPDVLFMTRRSRQQLQASRTATNPTGQPAPIPDNAFGIPIAVTEALVDTETLAL